MCLCVESRATGQQGEAAHGRRHVQGHRGARGVRGGEDRVTGGRGGWLGRRRLTCVVVVTFKEGRGFQTRGRGLCTKVLASLFRELFSGLVGWLLGGDADRKREPSASWVVCAVRESLFVMYVASLFVSGCHRARPGGQQRVARRRLLRGRRARAAGRGQRTATRPAPAAALSSPRSGVAGLAPPPSSPAAAAPEEPAEGPL